MDYRQALSFKVIWVKEMKPTIKEIIEELKETAADNKRQQSNCLEDQIYGEHLVRFATMVRDEKEQYQAFHAIRRDPAWFSLTKAQQNKFVRAVINKIDFGTCVSIAKRDLKQSTFMLGFFEQTAKRDKYQLCALSYLYNEDLQNAIKYLHKFKSVCAVNIEDVDGIVEYGALSFNNNPNNPRKPEQPVREDAYNTLCKCLKNKIDNLENGIAALATYKTEAKPILKATKRMLKRKNAE